MCAGKTTSNLGRIQSFNRQVILIIMVVHRQLVHVSSSSSELVPKVNITMALTLISNPKANPNPNSSPCLNPNSDPNPNNFYDFSWERVDVWTS